MASRKLTWGRIAGLSVFLALAWSPLAGAVSLAPPAGVARSATLDLYQAWADASRVKTPARTLVVALVDCDHISPACLKRGTNGWYLRYPDYSYLATYGESEMLPTRVEFMHELGHVLLFENPRLGKSVAAALGYNEPSADADEHSADEYAFCAVFGSSVPKRAQGWGYRFDTTSAQRQQVCRLLRRP